jgi:hypothetical protein
MTPLEDKIKSLSALNTAYDTFMAARDSIAPEHQSQFYNILNSITFQQSEILDEIALYEDRT